MKERVEFIDLAKGFGILFIIAYHIRILPMYLSHLLGACVPLFFIISGLFFQAEEKFKPFVTKKINTILVPFIFFYSISYLIFYMVEILSPGLIKTQAKGILDVFASDDYFNGPIWFLLSLFWDFIILWGIFKGVKSNVLRFIAVVTIALGGIVLSYYNVFLPMKLAPAFSCLPFLYIGNLVSKTGILNTEKKVFSISMAIVLLISAIVLTFLFEPIYMNLYNNTIIGNPFVNYLVVIFSSLGIILLCKIVNYIPFVNYFGKYSLIPLCLHHVIYRPILMMVSKLPPPHEQSFNCYHTNYFGNLGTNTSVYEIYPNALWEKSDFYD